MENLGRGEMLQYANLDELWPSSAPPVSHVMDYPAFDVQKAPDAVSLDGAGEPAFQDMYAEDADQIQRAAPLPPARYTPPPIDAADAAAFAGAQVGGHPSTHQPLRPAGPASQIGPVGPVGPVGQMCRPAQSQPQTFWHDMILYGIYGLVLVLVLEELIEMGRTTIRLDPW